ncbi:PEP-utilizing enzyme [Streptomyces sp. AM 4-1-1]|uniref:PEP-utilizing enzyme n=1 Tax=Streptomyces sp. AM 4-1-1 TaxID=3028710 RepID=UPI0023B8B9BD|nr:PEP-utilizing enzyme [Streptomyces sp. AM 4-1-1]WEH34279.1 PEP-utilizing enzyme [Streptomyces sp. AM 4-1-1]
MSDTVGQRGGVVLFGTKAETLARLAPRLRTAVVPPSMYFTVGEWKSDRAAVCERIRAEPWALSTLAVRSSSLDEDGEGASNAGRYTSCLEVEPATGLVTAVTAVIESFGVADDQDQVLVQPQLTGTVASGVCASCEPGTGAPYRLVNWSDGADTTVVTAGRAGIRTWRFLAYEDGRPPVERLGGLPALARELEGLLGDGPFEFEFAVTPEATIVLFQARPLAAPAPSVSRVRHRAAVRRCRQRFDALLSGRPQAVGSDTLLGVMPDWNPAEMIGLRPRPLALSLYRHLITDEIWAEARHDYGYRDLRNVPLLIDLEGLPYIDIRASFSSLMPRDLGEAPARRLMRHYLGELRCRPHLHDKVEFAIVQSSYHFTTPRFAASAVADGILSVEEAEQFAGSLRALTTDMIGQDGPYRRDLRTVRRLSEHPLAPATGAAPHEHTRHLLGLCRRAGALPFAGIARAAFAATSLVRSLTDRGVWSADTADALLGSADTVTNQLRRDHATGDREAFLRRYGHLRPGTYDILSPRYDECAEQYFDWASPTTPSPPTGPTEFHADAVTLRDVGRLLAEHRIPYTADALLEFVRGSVAAREYAKLQYSRVVSEILRHARHTGDRLGFDAEDMSYTTVRALAELTGDRTDDRRRLGAAVARGRDRYAVTRSLHAPALLSAPEELTSFVPLDVEPNFVAHARVVAPVADVDAGEPLDGAIAMILAADPGYDWIFTHNIVGLVTAFGGANSHMAIRALELGLPAVIGAGDVRFRQWLSAGSLEIDAANRLVRPAHTPGASGHVT